jgi:tetratricopeptide (TPR) repeat protein
MAVKFSDRSRAGGRVSDGYFTACVCYNEQELFYVYSSKGVTMKNYKAFIILFICIVFAGAKASAGDLDLQHYFEEGNTYFNEGQYTKALESYSRVIALYPDFLQGYYNRGLAYYKAGKYDEAIADYSKVLSTTSDNADLYNNRALAYLKKGDYENAIADYTKVISLNARHPDAYHNRGIAFANVGRYDEAIEDYNRVVTMKPKDPNIYLSRGVVYTKKAMSDFRRSCDMGNQLACDNLKQLSR